MGSKKAAALNAAAVIIVYAAAWSLGGTGKYIFSGSVLIMLAVGEYIYQWRTAGYFLDARAVFALFWIGGEGLSAMKLSYLATDWQPVTWFCFIAVFLAFLAGYDIACMRREKKTRAAKKDGPLRRLHGRVFGRSEAERPSAGIMAHRIMVCIYVLLGVSLACFIFEAAVLGYIPLFSDEAHAYSYFHITGVHYFTVSGIFVLPLSVIYCCETGRPSRGELIKLAVCCVLALSVPVLCVSRFQLLFAVMLAVCAAAAAWKGFKIRYVFIAAAAVIPAYVFLTVARNHDVAYLNSIFEMKNENIPIFITQPYIYVANNYDNFNCLVEQLTSFTFGLRQLFPLFALTGLKFIFPQLVSFPIYVTKTELTTVTLIYDAYYDLGAFGVIIFGLVLGFACRKLYVMSRRQYGRNPIALMFYTQAVLYLVLSFFTTWYSNPTTWFWYAITFVMYVYVGRRDKSVLPPETAGADREVDKAAYERS